MPQAALVEDASGNLYGTTSTGGTSNNGGTIFELKHKRANKWVETILYQFCPAQFCSDGSDPMAPLILDAAGNLLGTTSSGGQNGEHNTVFKLAPRGVHSHYSVLYTFCMLQNCADGSGSNAALTLDGSGNLFGPDHVGRRSPMPTAASCSRSTPTTTRSIRSARRPPVTTAPSRCRRFCWTAPAT